MANTKTAKENIKINQRNYTRNSHYKAKMKTLLRDAHDAIQSQSDTVQASVRIALRFLDTLVSKGIIKSNVSARKKSKLAIQFHQYTLSSSQSSGS